MRGFRSAVRLRRRVRGPLRPTWDDTFETLAELFHQGGRRVIRMPVGAQRRSTEAIVLQLPTSPLYRETHFEQVRAGGVPAEWFRRRDAPGGPVILYLHGGGYGLGSIETHRDLVARLCRAGRASALSIDYRLAPEYKFPAQLEDSTAAYRWLLAEGVDPKRIVIAGDSAGGGLTLATLANLRDSRDPLPAAGVCLSPWVDLEATGESMAVNERYDYISRRAILQYAKRFADPHQRRNPLAAPLYADLQGLPPLLIQAGSAEVLLDDAKRIAARAEAAGVEVCLEIWDDMIHVWQLFAFLSPRASRAIERIGEFIRQHTTPDATRSAPTAA